MGLPNRLSSRSLRAGLDRGVRVRSLSTAERPDKPALFWLRVVPALAGLGALLVFLFTDATLEAPGALMIAYAALAAGSLQTLPVVTGFRDRVHNGLSQDVARRAYEECAVHLLYGVLVAVVGIVALMVVTILPSQTSPFLPLTLGSIGTVVYAVAAAVAAAAGVRLLVGMLVIVHLLWDAWLRAFPTQKDEQ